MAESVDAKAARYLLAGRLQVLMVVGDEIHAECRGGGEVYKLGHTTAGVWWCDCPARVRCSHLVALQHVTVVRRGRVAGRQAVGHG